MSTHKMVILPQLNNRRGDISKQWFVFYSYLNPATGKMVQKRVYKGFSDKKTASAKYKHAQKLVDELTNKLEAGWMPEDDEKIIYMDTTLHRDVVEKYSRKRKSNRNFRYYASKYLNLKEHTLRKSSYQTYQSKYRVFISWLERKSLLDYDITAIDEDTMLKFVDYLLKEHRNQKDKTKGISNKMVNSYINTLSSVFSLVEKERRGFRNPMARIEYLEESSQPSEVYNDRMIKAIRDYAMEHDEQLWTIILFIYYTFIRPGELRFLRVKHVDLFQGFIVVPAEIAKNAHSRRVQIPERFAEHLRKFNLLQYDQNDYLITTKGKPGKHPVGKNYMWNHFEKIRKHYNIPRTYKFYGFKHTGAADLDRAGVSLKYIQMQIDHHSLDMTDKYLQSLRKKRSDQIDRFKPGWED